MVVRRPFDDSLTWRTPSARWVVERCSLSCALHCDVTHSVLRVGSQIRAPTRKVFDDYSKTTVSCYESMVQFVWRWCQRTHTKCTRFPYTILRNVHPLACVLSTASVAAAATEAVAERVWWVGNKRQLDLLITSNCVEYWNNARQLHVYIDNIPILMTVSTAHVVHHLHGGRMHEELQFRRHDRHTWLFNNHQLFCALRARRTKQITQLWREKS